MKSSASSHKITAENVALALDPDARQDSRGYMCRCPGHDDGTPSLRVFDRDGVDGVSFHCFAGCKSTRIHEICRGQGIETGSVNASKEPVIDTLYPYFYYDDSFSGAVKQRWARPDGGKLLDRHPKATWGRYFQDTDTGELVWAEGRKPALDYDVLYRGNRLTNRMHTVLAVEGEKDCDTAWDRMFACVGLPAAQGFKWSQETGDLLAGRRVVLVPDNDKAGQAAMERFGRICLEHGVEVCWLSLPGLETKEDLTDWFEKRGGSQKKLFALLDGLEPVSERDLGWRDRLEFTDSGKIISTYQNVFVLLENAPRFRDRLSYDTFRQTVLWDGKEVSEGLPAQLGVSLHEESGWSSANDGQVRTAMLALAEQRAFDSLKDHVEGLSAWDGVERLDTWLRDYCGASGEFAGLIGRKFLIGMIARAMEPGCKFDTALVLEGGQGIGKSTVCSILGGPFYMETLPDLSNKTRTAEEIQGVWLVEDAEMESASKQDVKRLKSFLSTRSDRFRGAYMRKAINAPRRCVMIVTTNRDDYLVDETGLRRFWPVRCENIDLDGLERDRDQLLAEAYAAWAFGEKTYLEGDHTHLQKTATDQRFDLESSDVADMVDWYLVNLPSGRGSNGTRRKEPLNVVHVPTMLRDLHACGRVPVGSSDRVLGTLIGKLFRHRGWYYKKVRDGLDQFKAWVEETSSAVKKVQNWSGTPDGGSK